MGLHIDGLVDNGSGSRIRDDLSGGRRAVDGVIGREHFNRVGNAFRRRIFLSRTNFSAENFWSGTLLGGRGVAVVEGIIMRRGEVFKKILRERLK